MKTKLILNFLMLGLVSFTTLSAEDFCCETSNLKDPGFYVSAVGGANWSSNEKKRVTASDEAVDSEGTVIVTDYKFNTTLRKARPGFLVGGIIGYKFAPIYTVCAVSPRVEAEFTYRRNQLSHFQVDYLNYSVSGNTNSMSYMANFLGDIDVGMPIVPYVGFGLGFMHSSTTLHFPEVETFHKKTNRFAYQLIAGVNYPICDQMELSINYNYIKGIDLPSNNSVCASIKRFF